MAKKPYRSKKQKQLEETAATVLAIEAIIRLVVVEGGMVLRESFGFTPEQATAWLGETIARAETSIQARNDRANSHIEV